MWMLMVSCMHACLLIACNVVYIVIVMEIKTSRHCTIILVVNVVDVEGITPEVIKTDEIAAEEAVLDSFENATGEIITKVVPTSVADTEKQETNGAFGTWISNFMPSKAGFLALGAGVAAVLVVFAIGGHFNKTT